MNHQAKKPETPFKPIITFARRKKNRKAFKVFKQIEEEEEISQIPSEKLQLKSLDVNNQTKNPSKAKTKESYQSSEIDELDNCQDEAQSSHQLEDQRSNDHDKISTPKSTRSASSSDDLVSYGVGQQEFQSSPESANHGSSQDSLTK